ncbi:MAG TPA: NDP-sugar synthase [Thermoplasmata archaeon]|nr:NDP-sugar synthase [Thermoplasmata archaeon]
MKALMLVGGLGTRLRPITYSVPKQLIPLAGKPMLFHVLDLLPNDIEEVVLATGYKSDMIDAFLLEHPPRMPIRTVPEAEPLGTGGGMRNAGDGMSDPFYLLNSDVIARVDLREMARQHAAHGGIGTMGLFEIDDTRPYGVAALDSDDRIREFVEKPESKDAPSHWINAGFAVWNREVVDKVPPGQPVSFEREILPGLLGRGVYGFRMTGYFDDAGTPERLLRSQRLLFDDGRGGKGTLPSGSFGKGPVALMSGARATGASFGPYVTVGPGVVVEAGAHVENSILMEGVHVERDATVSGSVLAPKVRVHSGHRLVNQVLGEGVEA